MIEMSNMSLPNRIRISHFVCLLVVVVAVVVVVVVDVVEVDAKLQ